MMAIEMEPSKPGNSRVGNVLSALLLSCVLLSSFTLSADELPSIVKTGPVKTGTGDSHFIPPFKLDCVTQSDKSPAPTERFKLAANMAEHSHQGHDQHAHHRMMMDSSEYRLMRADYPLPDVALTSHRGVERRLAEIVDTGKPVMLNFIFTTCTTICPVLSASFHQVQEILGDESESVSMVSITIDPDFDTPEQLMNYSKRFKAGDQWQFYTGSYEDVVAVEKAFDIFRGSKMNHEPITLIRNHQGQPWTRIDGLASAEDIVKEYRKIVAAGSQ